MHFQLCFFLLLSVAAPALGLTREAASWSSWLPCSTRGYQIRVRDAPASLPRVEVRSCWGDSSSHFHEGDIWPAHAYAALGSYVRDCTPEERAGSCVAGDHEVCFMRCLEPDAHCTRLASCGGRGYLRTDNKRFEVLSAAPDPLVEAYNAACGPNFASATAVVVGSNVTVARSSCVCLPGATVDGLGRPCGRAYSVRVVETEMWSVCGVGVLRAYARCRGAVCSTVHACECADSVSSDAFRIDPGADLPNYGDAAAMAVAARKSHPHADDRSWPLPRPLFSQCACSMDRRDAFLGACAQPLRGCDARANCGQYAEGMSALCVVPGRCIPAWFACSCAGFAGPLPSAPRENGVVSPPHACNARRDACSREEVARFCPAQASGRFTSCSVMRGDDGAELVAGSCGGFQTRRRACASVAERFASCGSPRAECIWDDIEDKPLPLVSRACVCELGRVWGGSSCVVLDRGFTECTLADRAHCPAPPERPLTFNAACRARSVSAHANFTLGSRAFVAALMRVVQGPLDTPEEVAAVTTEISALDPARSSVLLMLPERSQATGVRATTLRVPECRCTDSRGRGSWVSRLEDAQNQALARGRDLTPSEVASLQHACPSGPRDKVTTAIQTWLFGHCPSTHGIACNGQGVCSALDEDSVTALADDARQHSVGASNLVPGAAYVANVQFLGSHPYAATANEASALVRALVHFLYSRATELGAVGVRWVQLLPGFIEDGFAVPVEARDGTNPAHRSRPSHWHAAYLSRTTVESDEHVVMFQVNCDAAMDQTTEDLASGGARGEDSSKGSRPGYNLRRLLWENLSRRGVTLFDTDASLVAASEVQTPGLRTLVRHMYGFRVVGGDETDGPSTGDSCAARTHRSFGPNRARNVAFESPCLEWGTAQRGPSVTGFERTGGFQPEPTAVPRLGDQGSQALVHPNPTYNIFDRYMTQCEHVTNVECQHEMCVNSAKEDLDQIVRSRLPRVTRNGITCDSGSTFPDAQTVPDPQCRNFVPFEPFCACSVVQDTAGGQEYFNPHGNAKDYPENYKNDDAKWHEKTFRAKDAEDGRKKLKGLSCTDLPIGECFATIERGCIIGAEAAIFRNMRRFDGFEPTCPNTERTIQGIRELSGGNSICINQEVAAKGWNNANTNNGAHKNVHGVGISAGQSSLKTAIEAHVQCKAGAIEAAQKRLVKLSWPAYRTTVENTLLPGPWPRDTQLFEAVVGVVRSALKPGWCQTQPTLGYRYAAGTLEAVLDVFPVLDRADRRDDAADFLAGIYASIIFDERVFNRGVSRARTHLPEFCTDQELLEVDSGSQCDRCPRMSQADRNFSNPRAVWWRDAPAGSFVGASGSPVYTVMDYVAASSDASRLANLYARSTMHVGDGASVAPAAQSLRIGTARSMHKVHTPPSGLEQRHLLPGLIAIWHPAIMPVGDSSFSDPKIARFHPFHLALNSLWMFPHLPSGIDSDPILGYQIKRDSQDSCLPPLSTGYSRPADSVWRHSSPFGPRRATLFDWSKTRAEAPRNDPSLKTDRVGYFAFRATGGTERPEMCVVTGKVGRFSLFPASAGGLGHYDECQCSAPFKTPVVASAFPYVPTHAQADASSGLPHACTDTPDRRTYPALASHCLEPVIQNGVVVGHRAASQSTCVFQNSTTFCGNGYWDHVLVQCVCAFGFEIEAGSQDVAQKRCVRSANACSGAGLGNCNGRGSIDLATCTCRCDPPSFGSTCEFMRGGAAMDTCGRGRGVLNTVGVCECVSGGRGGWDGDADCTTARIYDMAFADACVANDGELTIVDDCAEPVIASTTRFNLIACARSSFVRCECPSHRYGERCEHTLCPRDANGRECGGHGECAIVNGRARCSCETSCETRPIDLECRARMDLFTRGLLPSFPSWGGCACDVDLRAVCAPPREINLCGSTSNGYGLCTHSPGGFACDCRAAETIGANGTFCLETLCPVSFGRVCNGRRCVARDDAFVCDCAPRLGGDRLLTGAACEIDATVACGVQPGFSGLLVRECSNNGVCNCVGAACACVCAPGFTGPKCQISLCPQDCVNGRCVPGEGGRPPSCTCLPAYTNAVDGRCTQSACLHGASPAPDGASCICANPAFSHARRCLSPDCARDETGEQCGRRQPLDDFAQDGAPGDTLLKKCTAAGTCSCDPDYYVLTNRTCAWRCNEATTASVLRGGSCQCKNGWRGPRCLDSVCHSSAVVTPVGSCTCLPPSVMTAGGACNVRKCINGRLQANGECACFAGFRGALCETSVCGHNAPWDALLGRCVCSLPIAGVFCNETRCGDQADYRDGACVCREGWTGPGCGTRICNGNYVPDIMFPSECVCEPHFSGPDCTPPPCIHGVSLCERGSCSCLCDGGFMNDPNTGQCTRPICGAFGLWTSAAGCTCAPGFTLFPNRIPRCQRNCFAPGTLEYDADTGVCLCDVLYTGPTCSALRSEGALPPDAGPPPEEENDLDPIPAETTASDQTATALIITGACVGVLVLAYVARKLVLKT